MNYKITKNSIIIENSQEFSIKHTLDCGQIFCYEQNQNSYIVYSASEKAVLKEQNGNIIIETNNPNYFVNYFDLNTNYTQKHNQITSAYPKFTSAFEFGKGIRILKQDPFETIIGFIISANNNIKRIQKLMFALRQNYGTNMGEYHAFPTASQLANVSEQSLKALGAGYRAPYILQTSQMLQNVNYQQLSQMSTQELSNYLLTLKGVGQKVADCIMLFAFAKQDVFPVDTWIEKVYCTYFEQEQNRVKIRKNLLQTFGNDSGYVQQLLFYSQRKNM